MTIEAIADLIYAGELQQAETALASAEQTEENRLRVKFLRGLLKEMNHDRAEALEEYKQVLEEDADNRDAAFHAAMICNQGGDSETAMELYERCAANPPVPASVLLNLAMLYEESGLDAAAERCIKSVLEEHPRHRRAIHLFRSVKRDSTIVYDERCEREAEQRDALLDQPLSDFELSVRSRNCLRQMNLRTVGDLLRTTETELLAYKNFGETSLNEIKAMLGQKNLHIGQAIEPAVEQPGNSTAVPLDGDQAVAIQRSVSEMELSVRARKCLQRLGITTIGELTARSEAELTNVKNFGQTSLAEIKRQLSVFGLSLRQSG